MKTKDFVFGLNKILLEELPVDTYIFSEKCNSSRLQKLNTMSSFLIYGVSQDEKDTIFFIQIEPVIVKYDSFSLIQNKKEFIVSVRIKNKRKYKNLGKYSSPLQIAPILINFLEQQKEW